MLSTLRIRNLVIFEDLTIRFGPGLNLLTGETGAGKSILVDALGLVGGARSDRSLVRSGAKRANRFCSRLGYGPRKGFAPRRTPRV